MKEYKQGDKVVFDLNDVSININGMVCGKVGPIIIVELIDKLKGYDFTHIYVLDSQIKK